MPAEARLADSAIAKMPAEARLADSAIAKMLG
jgi:hypothetical protein